MTKKDFELIASSISHVIEVNADNPAGQRGAEAVALVLANSLKETNPRFNRDRFLLACGRPGSQS